MGSEDAGDDGIAGASVHCRVCGAVIEEPEIRSSGGALMLAYSCREHPSVPILVPPFDLPPE